MHIMEKMKQIVLGLAVFSAVFGGAQIAHAQTSNVTCNAATLNGYVAPNGNSTSVWFEWGTSNGTVSSGAGTKTPTQTFTSNATYSYALSGLSQSTTYYYRAMAQNQDGSAAGSILSFTTPSCGTPPSGQAPIATTQSASSIDANDANLNGYVDPNGASSVTRWFEYGTNSGNLSNSTNRTTASTAGQTSAFISNLSSNTTYYFRVGAQNSSATTYGSIMSFTTNGGSPQGQAPIATTQSASNIGQGSATLNGYVDPNGGSNTVYWFEYGPSSSNLYMQTSTQNTSSAGNVSGYASGMVTNHTYYFRVGARNSNGTTYGSTQSFTTGGGQTGNLPIATTNAAQSVDANDATLTGYVDPNGTSDTVRWFEYGPSQGNLYNQTSSLNIGYAGTASAYVSNLQTNTTYYFRVAARNSAGTVYGQVMSFTTNGGGCNGCNNNQQPTATTNAATSIDQNDAQLNGYVSSNGNGDVTRWFEWGTNSGSFQNSSTRVDVGQSGSVQTFITNLQANTTYYFRVDASNSAGTVYGQVMSFTTNGGGCNGCNNNEQQPSVTTNSAQSVDNYDATLTGYVNVNGTTDTSRWFEYGTNSGSFSYQTSRLNIGYSGSASAYVSNLSPNTTYYFRIDASNAAGTVYGQVMSFTTNGNNGGCTYNCGGNYGNAPIVNTRSADSVNSTSANLNGYVDANGSNNTSAWFDYGTSYSFGYQTSRHYQGNNASNIAAYLNGLQANTTYYYRAAATNDYGTTYGQTMSFTTNGGGSVIVNNGQAPTAITTVPTGVSASAATLNGFVVSDGTDSITSWFEYGTSMLLGQSTNHATLGSSPSLRNFAQITGLSYGQTYYYRIVAQNSHGTDYGAVRSFIARNAYISTPAPTPTRHRTTTRVVRQVVTQPVVHADGVDSLVMLTITGGNDTIAKGEHRSYHVTWNNVSDQTLSNVVLRILVPQTMNFESSDSGTFSKVDSTLTLELGTLQPGQQGEMNLTLNAGDSLKIGDLVVTTANLVYTDQSAVQGDALAYTTQRVVDGGSVLGASVGSASFPVVLLGWLLLIILIVVLLILCHHLYKRLTEGKSQA